MAKPKRQKTDTFDGGKRLDDYFKGQREKFGDRGGDSMKKMGDRIGRTRKTIFMITKGAATTYETAKLIEGETGIPWHTFQPAGRARAAA